MKNYKELLKDIKVLIFDYDGVLTDGTVLTLQNCEQVRPGNVKDGYALQFAVRKGFRIVILSGGYSESMLARCKTLGITELYFDKRNKLEVYKNYIKENNIMPEQVMFMGDDIPDLQVMKEVGLATCPADAVEEIKNVSDYISPYCGGKGCVRDIIEQIMKVQGKWLDNDAFTW